MATLTGTAAQSNIPAVYNATGTTTRVVSFTHNVALSAGDVVQLVRLPVGAIIQNWAVATSFSAGVVSAGLGISASNSVLAALVLSGAASIIGMIETAGIQGMGYVLSVEDTINLTVTAISAPPATATIALQITYTNQAGS